MNLVVQDTARCITYTVLSRCFGLGLDATTILDAGRTNAVKIRYARRQARRYSEAVGRREEKECLLMLRLRLAMLRMRVRESSLGALRRLGNAGRAALAVAVVGLTEPEVARPARDGC